MKKKHVKVTCCEFDSYCETVDCNGCIRYLVDKQGL
jgi:hypothetical protein